MVLDDLRDRATKKWRLHAVSATDLGKAMAERDAYYKLAGLIEVDDTYVGGPKSGKRGRGAGGQI